MTYIVSYRKHTDAYTTHRLALPVDLDGTHIGTELATIDGLTYVSLPAEVELPSQPTEIAASVSNVILTPALRSQIKTKSAHCKLIAERVIEQIRAAYTLDDELYYGRIAAGAANGLYSPTAEEFQELELFTETLESVRAWGRVERAKLGL